MMTSGRAHNICYANGRIPINNKKNNPNINKKKKKIVSEMWVSLLCILDFPSSSKNPRQVVWSMLIIFNHALDVFCSSSFSNRIQHGASDVKESRIQFFEAPLIGERIVSLSSLSFNGRACLNLNERLEGPLSCHFSCSFLPFFPLDFQTGFWWGFTLSKWGSNHEVSLVLNDP